VKALVRIFFSGGGLGFVATPENLWTQVEHLAPFVPHEATWVAYPLLEHVSDNLALREGP
jgi:hypothetical protein